MTHAIMVDEARAVDFPAIVSSRTRLRTSGGRPHHVAQLAIRGSTRASQPTRITCTTRGAREDEGAVNLEASWLHTSGGEHEVRPPIVTDRYEKPNDVFDAHTYPKGARVLHMLRALLGDAAFFDVLKHFLHRHAFDAVDTSDFIRSVKTVTGQNLDWFFDQWLFRPGHPSSRSAAPGPGAEGRVVEGRAGAGLLARHPGLPAPVAVAVVTREAGRAPRSGSPAEETFEIAAPSRPAGALRREQRLLKELRFPKPIEELIYQLQHDDVIGG